MVEARGAGRTGATKSSVMRRGLRDVGTLNGQVRGRRGAHQGGMGASQFGQDGDSILKKPSREMELWGPWPCPSPWS